MPTLATGNPNSPRRRIRQPTPMRIARSEAGFTLVEILVVIVIVGTMLSIAMLSFSLAGDDRELKSESRRFAALAEVALDEATMQGREFGIELMTAGYRFVEYDALTGRWAEVPGDDTLRLRALPETLEFELFIEDKRIKLDNDPATFEDPEENSTLSANYSYAPHLLVYSSGDTTPFELHVYRDLDDLRVVLRGDALGAIEIVNPDDE
jgi:general secretion pathway protein H